MIIGIIIGVVWVLSGVVPALVCWYKSFDEMAPSKLIILSIILGPIAGITNYVQYRITRK